MRKAGDGEEEGGRRVRSVDEWGGGFSWRVGGRVWWLGLRPTVASAPPLPLGASMFAFLMGTMANIVSNMDSVTARVLRKRGAVDEFLRQRNVPR